MLQDNQKSNEAHKVLVQYLGHSSYSVKTKSHFIIFDYYDDNRVNGVYPLDMDKLTNENIIIFSSHRHSDHFAKSLENWIGHINQIKFVYGWRVCGNENIIGVKPHEDIKIGGVLISTLRSTDAGVGYLVKVDGMTVFHAGDHANWEDNSPNVSFEKEIDYIAEKANGIDIAFLTATTFRGMRPRCLTEGAVYAIKKLNAKIVFPMHGNGREYLYREFANEDSVKETGAKVICPEKLGDIFEIQPGTV